MNLVILYGPPAVGKLTVGTELAKLTGYKLFHNHLAGNVAEELFVWGSLAYKELKRTIWEAAFDAAIRHKLPGMIFTYVYRKPKNERYIVDLIDDLGRRGTIVHLVQLTSTFDELRRRIPNDSRKAAKKLVEVGKFEQYWTEDVTSMLPIGDSFVVDTTTTLPEKTVQLIQAHYQLPVVEEEQ